MTALSSIDFTMPQGMSPDEHVAWLYEIGAQLREVSGQRSGSTPQLDVGGYQRGCEASW